MGGKVPSAQEVTLVTAGEPCLRIRNNGVLHPVTLKVFVEFLALSADLFSCSPVRCRTAEVEIATLDETVQPSLACDKENPLFGGLVVIFNGAPGDAGQGFSHNNRPGRSHVAEHFVDTINKNGDNKETTRALSGVL